MHSWIRLPHICQWLNLPSPKEDPFIKGITPDSREVKAGDLFVAYKGPSNDGHDFISQAVQKGAVAILAECEVKTSVPLLKVADGKKALVDIAKAMRESFKGKVFALTGSAGKSSTKEMIFTLLGNETVASPASFNNLIGLSRTLFLMNENTKNLVLEMGMNAPLEIKTLCEVFKPQGGLITNIGTAHAGYVGGPEGVYKAKKELFDYLSIEGSLGVCLNEEDSKVVQAYKEAFKKKPKTITYTTDEKQKADVQIVNSEPDPKTGKISCRVQSEISFETEISIFGSHQAKNLAAAIAAARLFGISWEEIQKRIKNLKPAPHRGEVYTLAKEIIFIDESYNSNPEALYSSMESLSKLNPSKRKVLVLGEMKELGEYSEKLHREAGKKINALFQNQKGLVFGVGENSRFLGEELKTFTFKYLKNVQEAIQAVPPHLEAGDILLIKGSRGNALDKLGDFLLAGI